MRVPRAQRRRLRRDGGGSRLDGERGGARAVALARPGPACADAAPVAKAGEIATAGGRRRRGMAVGTAAVARARGGRGGEAFPVPVDLVHATAQYYAVLVVEWCAVSGSCLSSAARAATGCCPHQVNTKAGRREHHHAPPAQCDLQWRLCGQAPARICALDCMYWRRNREEDMVNLLNESA